jgi:L-2-hydroxyglutarate oxidase LhgO
MLYAFCRDFGTPHLRCGKLLVAANAEEVDKLAALKVRAEANGVTDLIWLSAEEARALGLWCELLGHSIVVGKSVERRS